LKIRKANKRNTAETKQDKKGAEKTSSWACQMASITIEQLKIDGNPRNDSKDMSQHSRCSHMLQLQLWESHTEPWQEKNLPKAFKTASTPKDCVSVEFFESPIK